MNAEYYYYGKLFPSTLEGGKYLQYIVVRELNLDIRGYYFSLIER